MDRIVWIIIAVVALAVAGFFGFRASQTAQSQRNENERTGQLETELAALRAREQEMVRLEKQEANARELAENKVRQAAEAEARRLAQAQAERDAQENARAAAEAEAARAAEALEALRMEKARIESQAQQTRELRKRERAEAEAKLRAAQESLADLEARKNAEIARQAALIDTYSRQERPTPIAAIPDEEKRAHKLGPRYVFPADYKRGPHTLVPLLPATSGERN